MSTTPADATTARRFADAFLDQSIAEAVELVDQRATATVLDSLPEWVGDDSTTVADALEAYWWGLYGQYGPAEGIADVTVSDDAASVDLAFESGVETLHLSIGEQGVTDVWFDPAYEVPSYVKQDAFTEREVTVDAGDVSLDGLLTVPDGEAAVPGVVLVHGAGSVDLDATMGASKILRDFAWGLASEGIATLRYEKRTTAHDVPDDEYTLDTVVVDDAVAAANTLAAAEEVRTDATFVAGHSQGGMAAPRIAARHDDIAAHNGDLAGIAILDGTPNSILAPEHVDIIRYEFEIDGDLDDEQQAELEDARETYERIHAGEFDDDEPIMGRPAVWFRSLLEYDPTATASGLDHPVFVATTRRADDETQPELAAFQDATYEGWRTTALPDGSTVTQYDGLDHHFQPGYAPTHPLSLDFGGNVAQVVVDDLATWIDTVLEH